MKIIIETESLEELRQIAKELSGVAPEKPKKAKKETIDRVKQLQERRNEA